MVGGRDIHFSFRLIKDVAMRADWLTKHKVNVAVTLLFDRRPADIKKPEMEKRRL